MGGGGGEYKHKFFTEMPCKEKKKCILLFLHRLRCNGPDIDQKWARLNFRKNGHVQALSSIMKDDFQ